MRAIAGAAGVRGPSLEHVLADLLGRQGSGVRVRTAPSAGIAIDDGGRVDRGASSDVAWLGSPPSAGATNILHTGSDCAAIALDGDDGLVLARGPFGGRPLYYANDQRRPVLAASSRLEPLLATLDAPPPNVDWIASYIVDEPLSDQSSTPYRHIARVPSSTNLRVGAAGRCQRLDLPFASRPRRVAPIDMLAAELRDRILGAVRRAVPENEDVAVLVSGGLDSSGVLAATIRVARERGSRVRVFTLHFEGPGDDRPHLAAVCQMYGVEPVRMRPRDCSTSLRDTLVIDRTPIENPIGAQMAKVLREHGVTRVLTGEGGDDVFGGDMRVFADRAWSGHPGDAIRQAIRLKAWGKHRAWPRVRTLVLRPTVIRLLPRRLAGLRARLHRRHWPTWAGPELVRVLSTGAAAPDDLHWEGRSSERSWLEYRATSTYYLDCSAARAQMELVGGFLRCDPLLDSEVIDFIASLAPEQLFHGGWLRGLYREALRGWVPDSLRLRPDKADFEPALVEFAGGADGLRSLSDLASCGRLAELGVVQPRAFRERFDRLAQTPTDGVLWLEVLRVLSAEALLRLPGASSS